MKTIFAICAISRISYGVRAISTKGLGNPLNLTFTPTTLVASRYKGSGGIELSKHPLELLYHDLYKYALRRYSAEANEPYDVYTADHIEASKLIFEDAVRPLTDRLAAQLGRKP